MEPRVEKREFVRHCGKYLKLGGVFYLTRGEGGKVETKVIIEDMVGNSSGVKFKEKQNMVKALGFKSASSMLGDNGKVKDVHSKEIKRIPFVESV